jgi:anti-sigma factor RsiW
MMTCRELAEILLDFVTGELPPELCRRLEQHLRLCSACSAYLDSYRTTTALPRWLPPAPLPPRLTTRLRMILDLECRVRDDRAEGGGGGEPAA